MKNQTKKLWDLYTALTNALGFAVLGTLLLYIVMPLAVYAGGFLVGISSLMGMLVGDILYNKRLKKGRVTNPFDRSYGLFGSPTYQNRDRTFYEKTNEYMQWVRTEHKSWKILLLPYVVVGLPTILFWRGIATEWQATVFLAMQIFFISIGGGILRMVVELREARDYHKISKFFGTNIEKWKVDLKPVSRPPSVTALMWIFLSIGVFGLALAPTFLITKALNVPLITSIDTASTALASFGAAFLGGMSFVAGLKLRKMMKEGALMVVLFCFFPLFLGVIAFVVVPLAGQVPIPLYHALWVFGIPLAVIYIIKRNWKKFRG